MKENENAKTEKIDNLLEKLITEPLKNKTNKISSYLNILNQIKTNSVSEKDFNENLTSITNNKINPNNKNIEIQQQTENKFSIKNLLNTSKHQNLELHKKKFFKFVDELQDESNFNEEKTHRDILISKLLKDDSIKIEVGLEKDNFEKFLTNSFLLFSRETRELIAGPCNQNKQNTNFHALIGFENYNNKINETRITKKEILAVCNKYISFTECKIKLIFVIKLKFIVNFHNDNKEDQKNQVEENKGNEMIKEEKYKRNVIVLEKKVDDINPLIINNTNNETINPKTNLDEELDNDTLNFFRRALNNSNNNLANTESIDKIGKLMELIEKSGTLTNKHKNEVLRQMKEKFLEEQINLIKKQKEIEEKNKLLLSKNNNINQRSENNPMRETIENQSNVNLTRSRINNSNYNLNKSEIENLKTKIVYAYQGWGIAENVKQSKNFNSKIQKPNDRSFVSNSKNSKPVNKSLSKSNVKKQGIDIKISGNQKIMKLANKVSKQIPNHKNKSINSQKLNNSDDEFFEDFD